MDFVAIDLETATADRNSACAMAIVIVQKSEIIAEHKFLIQPPLNEYAPINIRVHGISPTDTETEPTIEEYYNLIFDSVNGAKVVAHNASFDMSVMKHSLEYYGLTVPCPNSISCTYRMTGKSLKACCDEYGFELEHHEPLSDAKACARLFMRLTSDGVKMPEPAKRIHSTIKLRREALSTENIINKDSLFFGKFVVITGVFETFERTEIADAVQSLGASVKSSISPKTDILICGANCGPSKLAKVIEFKEQGVKNIEIVYEDYLHKIL